jgi:histidinol-phosphate aminotransferase
MNRKKLVKPWIRTLVPYPPGKPIEELRRETGWEGPIVKIASNENPIGPSPRALKAIKKALATLNRYPDGSGYYLREALSRHLSLPMDRIILGNGSNEIIELLVRTFLRPGEEVVIPEPTFLFYFKAIGGAGGTVKTIPLKNLAIDLNQVKKAVGEKTKLIILNNPNNPTGTIFTRTAFERFLTRLPQGVIVVLDEAYIEFVRDPECPLGTDYLNQSVPVLVLRTFSKVYGLAGLRIGYGLGPTEIIDYLNRVRQPFNVNALAQAAALAALKDQAFFDKTRQLVWEGMAYLIKALKRMGLHPLPSQTNFLLIPIPGGGRPVFEALLKEGVIVRAMESFGLPEYIRINVGLPEENRRFIAALRKVMKKLECG